MILDRPIGVAGAGSIGCFVGGMCAAAGRRVALLARPRVIQEIESNGLRLTSFEGFERRLARSQLTLSDDPRIFADAGVVLVTVKSYGRDRGRDRAPRAARCGGRQFAERRRQHVAVASAIAWTRCARGHGAVQCDRSW